MKTFNRSLDAPMSHKTDDGRREDRTGVMTDDDAAVHTCFKSHRAIAYDGDDCPVCELIERSSVLTRHIKTLERVRFLDIISRALFLVLMVLAALITIRSFL
jgi:hypothetical protein